MNKTMLFLVLIICALQSEAQAKTDSLSKADIVGVWQMNSGLVASALHENFQFLNNGTFIYNTDEYDDLNPLKSIYGVYKLHGNKLSLRVDSIWQLAGFRIADSDPGFEIGTFQLNGGTMKMTKQKDASFGDHIVEIVDKKTKKAITIDSGKYFKIASNPFKYK
jgi:hypothetical protein